MRISKWIGTLKYDPFLYLLGPRQQAWVKYRTFVSVLQAGHGIRHIFGKPYHPQGRGKIERFNRQIKGKLCLVVYCSPEELKKAADEAIPIYNATPHESLDNVSPNDVYAGRKEVVLQKRREKKRLTLERRKQYNLRGRNFNQNNDLDQG